VVGEKSRYHWPIAANGQGVATHRTPSATCESSVTVDAGATGTASTTFDAPDARATSIAARAVLPVASPSSTTTTTRPDSGTCAAGAHPPGSLLEHALLAGFNRRQLVVGDRPGPQNILFEDPDAAFADRAHRQLRATGHAELADHDHVERRPEHTRHLGRHRDSAPRQRDDDRVGVGDLGSARHQRRQRGTGFAPVRERDLGRRLGRFPVVHHGDSPLGTLPTS
jgi:hypothetical protein